MYLDVTGIANNNFNSGIWLDVYVTQSYITRPGLWGFSQWNIGSANGLAILGGLNGTGVADQLVLNSTSLPPLGFYGDATLGAWAFGAGPFFGTVGWVTAMTGPAQFYFSPGLFGQAIAIPMDVDFPDPALNGVLPDPIQYRPDCPSSTASRPCQSWAVCCCWAHVSRFRRRSAQAVVQTERASVPM